MIKKYSTNDEKKDDIPIENEDYTSNIDITNQESMSSTNIFKPILGKWNININPDNHIIGRIEIKTFPIMGWTFLHIIRRLSLGLSSSYRVAGFKFNVNNHGKDFKPSHEYESIAGIVEDVPYIHYNIKGVIVKVTKLENEDLQKVQEDEFFILKIHANHSGPLYASSIDVDSFNENNKNIQVEIVNKDHLICNLDLHTKFNGEILFRYGFGYVSEEDQEKYFNKYFKSSNREGYFFLSSQFSNGVLSVTGEVTEVTGGSVPYDSLQLEVITDGHISPEDVVINAFKLLSNQIPYDVNPNINKVLLNSVEDKNSYDGKKLLKDLGFLDAVVKLLERHGIYTLSQLLEYSAKSLMALKGFGLTKLNHIEETLKSMNLFLPSQDVDKKERKSLLHTM